MVTSSQSLSTRSLLMAQAYVINFLDLNEPWFIDALADEVSAVWARVEAGFELQKTETEGKVAVVENFHNNFFAVTSNFDLVETKYSGFGLHATSKCVIDQDKVDSDQIQRRYHMVCNIKLDFKEEGENLKIVKIWERTSKDLIPSSNSR